MYVEFVSFVWRKDMLLNLYKLCVWIGYVLASRGGDWKRPHYPVYLLENAVKGWSPIKWNILLTLKGFLDL